jgi:hypothetical protein
MKINVLIIAILPFVLIVGCHKSSDDNNLSFDEIKNKLESAEDGDTVNIPKGKCIFKTHIIINKNITLKGAGVDQTIFFNDQTKLYDAVLNITNNDKPIRITGITFQGKAIVPNDSDKSEFIYWHNTKQSAQITGFRIDHCKFIDGGKHAITIWGADDIFGVIDHCTFINAARCCNNTYGAAKGDLDWSRNEPLGTLKAIYIEDCSFRYDKPNYPEGFCETVTGINGARYVFRNNTISTIAKLNACQIDMHGNWYGDRSGYSVEIYNNTLYSENSWYGMYVRGGRGVIFNNNFIGLLFYEPIILANDGSFMPTKDNPRDQTYPAIDQINNFYIWQNYITCSYYKLNNALIFDGVPVPYVQNRGAERTLIKKDRDYFDVEMPGYVPYTYPHPLTKE